MRNTIKYFFLLTVPVLVGLLLFLEVLLRFVIPACEAPFCYYDLSDQVLRFEPHPKDGLHSIGPFAQQKGKWHINNAGWNNEIDYQSIGRTRPLVAIIGDSYVEAFHVDVDKNVAANLRRTLQNSFDVYSFAISGASLADYLHMSRYVRRTFKPDIMIINVVYNDFDESLCAVRSRFGRMCIELTDESIEEKNPQPYPPSQIRRYIATSALVRYLYNNLKAGNLNWFHYLGRGYSENVNVQSVNEFMPQIERACNYVVQTLAQENGKSKIMFVIDAPRNDIYSGQLANSKVIWMNKLLRDICAKNSVQYLDLTNQFVSHYEKLGMRFESKWDWHWNELGHEVVAQAVHTKMQKLGWVR